MNDNQVHIKDVIVNGKPAMQVNMTQKQFQQHAKRQNQRRKSNPRLYLNGENRTVIFEEQPLVVMDAQILCQLMSFNPDKIKVRLLGVEVLDGKATIHLEKE